MLLLLGCLTGHAQSRSMNDIADTPSTDQVSHYCDFTAQPAFNPLYSKSTSFTYINIKY